ncbi:TonB-dependent receptor [Luteimonas huabeiensis]|uniref:TonB-dependent receptor n=1 Tax=Luteimonas huabeiensis TaxID=1244513 RepID=UPI0004649E85|nr:TonB-dependent receptor [Luteimonas huabeiensis]
MPPRPHPLRASLLAAAVAALALPAALPVAAAVPGASTLDLPAGPLGEALSRFASQRGIALSFDPALTAGLQAPALRGEVGDREGLQRLLAGSGLRLVAREDGSYTLERESAAPAGAILLSPLRVGAQRTFPYSEGMVLDQDYIEGTSKGNGDIATLLRINPAVQFSDTARSSRSMGEIRPADISINGALPYQNLFMLDGVSFNNDLDPAKTFDSNNNIAHFSDLPSQSQGIAVDVDLLESLTVYDSNVPAAYGGFAGGVVEAQSRRAGGTFGGKVWMRMARSAWDELIIPEGQETTWANSANINYQPRYDKTKLGATLEGRTAGGLGLIGTVTRTRSEIPLRGYLNGQVSETGQNTKTQTRENTAATLAVDWSDGQGLELGANLTYAPTDDRYFIQNNENAYFDLKSGGPVLGLRANIERGGWTIRNTLSYSDLETRRSGETNYLRNWAKSEQYDWGINNSSAEGTWGNVEQHDRTIGYRLVADHEGLDFGRARHDVQVGLSYQHREAWYRRLNDHYNYQDPLATTSCTLADGTVDDQSCSLSPVLTSTSNGGLIAGQGQYFSQLFLYRAGEFTVSGDEWSAWAQDDVRLGDWSLRAGLRMDGSDVWDKTTLSPRLAASWDVLGNRDTLLTAGLNRYHGRNFFTYLLREGRERLRVLKERPDSATPWDAVEGTSATSTNRIADLDIPYSDEWTLGLDQRWAGWTFNLKYVAREGRDEVRRQRVRSGDDSGEFSANVYEYTNNGRSRSRTWTLGIALEEDLRLWASRTRIQLGFDRTDVRRNYTDYDDSWTEAGASERVRYKGDLLWLYDLPAADFNRPWTARLSTQTRIALGAGELLWSNFLRYRAGYRDIGLIGEERYEGGVIDVYDDVDYPNSFTWDATLEYAHALARGQEA